jgi:proteasome lid subunit RPN8/RPN11
MSEQPTLVIPRAIIDGMVAHAREDLPNECCGILAGRGARAEKLYRIANAEKSPFRYRMDDKELMKALREIDDDDRELLVIYHSHVKHPAYPSATDVRMAQWPGTDTPIDIFPDAYYVLISLRGEPPEVKAYKIAVAEGTITECPIVTV